MNNKQITLVFEKDKQQEQMLPEVQKPKDENKVTAMELTPIALACIKKIDFMLGPRKISKKFDVIYGPVNPGISGTLYKPLIIKNVTAFEEYLFHAVHLLSINSPDLYIPQKQGVLDDLVRRMYLMILTYSEGTPDRYGLFSELPKWDNTHKWCENGYFDENWQFHHAEIPKGVLKQLRIYIPDNWDTLIQDEGVGFQYITQFFRQLAWTREDYDSIVGKISNFLEKEPTKRALVGTASGLSGKYKGGFIYETLSRQTNKEGEQALAYMFLYCLEINTINEYILFLQSKGGGGKDSLVDPLVKLLGGVENNAQLSIKELTAEFLPAIVNYSNLIYNMEAEAKDIMKATRKLNQISGNSSFEVNSKNREPVPYVNFCQKAMFGLNSPIYSLGGDGSLNRRVVQYKSYWYTADDGVNPWRSFYVLGDPKYNLMLYDIDKSQIAGLPSYDMFPLLLLKFLTLRWNPKLTYKAVFSKYGLKGKSINDPILDIVEASYSKAENIYSDNKLVTMDLTDFINRTIGLKYTDTYVMCANKDASFKIWNNSPINVELLHSYDLKNTKFYMPLSTIAKLNKELLKNEYKSKELQDILEFNNYMLSTEYNYGTKAFVVYLDVVDTHVYMTFRKTVD